MAAAGDVVAMLDHLGLDEVVILGESLGGGTGILVDRLRPGLVRKLLLCEAIAMPAIDGLPGQSGENHMSAMARKRRAVWPDRDTVRESYGSRPPMNVMEPEALAGYVQWGFRDRPDGQVELSCPPEVEAWFFECGTRPDGAPASFEHLASLHADVDDRVRRRHRPARRHVRGAGRARRRRPHHRARHPLLRAGGHRPRRRPRPRAPRLIVLAPLPRDMHGVAAPKRQVRARRAHS